MRKDLGLSNFMLAEGDLGRAVLKDWDQVFGSDPGVVEPPEPAEEPRVSRAADSAGRTRRG